ncbi:MAG TPA: HPF/RaiA family ribosome-associated protein [Chitinophagaceae bacterium]|nr:HPF/RaiA family ribosome-associated protein [Chitinophagaceae bacterium]
MDIIIQSLGFKASDTLESFIRGKMNDLKSDGIVRANVTLYKGPSGNPESDYCEIRLEVPGNDLFVKKHNERFETAVGDCVEVLTQMIDKSKEKKVRERQAESEKIEDALLEGEGDDREVELEDVVK